MTKTASKRPSLASFAWRCLFAPGAAADLAREPGSLAPAAWLYVAFLLGTALLYSWKPFDFPDRNAPFPADTQNLWFWLKVMAWQPPLEAAWVVFLLAQLQWLKAGKMFWRLLGGVVATAAPFILLVVYTQGGLGKPAYAAGMAAWLALVIYWARLVPRELWRPVFALMLALNVIGLLSLAPMAIAVPLESDQLFKAAQIVSGLWVLLSGTIALRALAGQRLPRCFMAVLFSMFMQIAFAFALHMLGLVPKDILKALLYA